MTISTATQNHDYLGLIFKSDLTHTDKIILLYLLHPAYRDTTVHEHSRQLKLSTHTFHKATDRLEEKGYIEIIPRGDRGRLRNFNKYRVTSKAKRLCGAAA